MGNIVSKELNLKWQIWNMKRNYILERCIKLKCIPGRCDMAEYSFSPEELLPVYRNYLAKEYGADHYLFKGLPKNSNAQNYFCRDS